MKIKELSISNIMSFRYVENLDDATKITFDQKLNIFIGENGSGKSTALEVMNFLFKKVLFKQFNLNQDLFSRRSTLTLSDKKQILTPEPNVTFAGFRLDPNWNSESSPQKLRLSLILDDIDNSNIATLVANSDKIKSVIDFYTNHTVPISTASQQEYVIEITLNRANNSFAASISPSETDTGYLYLVNYNFYKELISLYNYEHPDDSIPALYESFTLIGGYRNYHTFNPQVSVQNSTADQQIQSIKNQEYNRSLNSSEQAEPAIFNLVRLRVAGKHFSLYGVESKGTDCVDEANKQAFLTKINKRLLLVNLEVRIDFTNKQKWGYSFQFYDLKRKMPLSDINCLSAGQKAIIHLVFEAYGRGDSKGGVVIIDEPEIHLHYQFQNEYLRVIDEINREQQCQYVLVTHSESLINSSTIHNVKRFALNNDNNTQVKSPSLTLDQKTLVKILDNTRSTYAFFAKKVVLVEGETDRYFFKAFLQELDPSQIQSVAVLDISGKPNFANWKSFFASFGLTVYSLCDLDAGFKYLYPTETPYKLCSLDKIAQFKRDHPNLAQDIESKYHDQLFILQAGALETYIDVHNKGLSETISFCNDKLHAFIDDTANLKATEMKIIFGMILAK